MNHSGHRVTKDLQSQISLVDISQISSQIDRYWTMFFCLLSNTGSLANDIADSIVETFEPAILGRTASAMLFVYGDALNKQ